MSPQTIAQFQTLAQQLADKDKQLAESRSRLSEVGAELKQLRQEIAQAKAANAAQPDPRDYTETRDHFINRLLKEAKLSELSIQISSFFINISFLSFSFSFLY